MEGVHSEVGDRRLDSGEYAVGNSDMPAAVALVGDDGQSNADIISPEIRSTIRILVIDDDRALREGCASILRVEGYNVTVWGRNDEVLESFRRSHFDIEIGRAHV